MRKGFGLPMSLQGYSTAHNLGIKYEPVLRYDVVVPEDPFWNSADPKQKEKYGFFADHHFTLYRRFSFSKRQYKKKHVIGLGYSFISPGLSYDRNWQIIDLKRGTVTNGNSVDLSFGGIHVLYCLRLYKNLYAANRLLYIQKNAIIYNYSLASMMFFLSVEYQMPIKRFYADK